MHARADLRGCRGLLLVFAAVATASLAGCGPKYPKCDKDDQCKDHGEVCVEGTCQQCREDSSCGPGQICKGGRCEAKPECARDTECTDNKVCRSGKCQTECASNSDCGKGLRCTKNRCVDELACDQDSDCPGGVPCIQGRCGATDATREANLSCAPPRVRFPFNEATLSAEARDGLEGYAKCLKSKSTKVTVEGHCDERGTEEYNLALGEQRATAVKKYLERLGVEGRRLRTLSKGELEPIAPGHDEASWAQNRRAEFVEQ